MLEGTARVESSACVCACLLYVLFGAVPPPAQQLLGMPPPPPHCADACIVPLLPPRCVCARLEAQAEEAEEGDELDEDDVLLARMEAGLYTLHQVRLPACR